MEKKLIITVLCGGDKDAWLTKEKIQNTDTFYSSSTASNINQYKDDLFGLNYHETDFMSMTNEDLFAIIGHAALAINPIEEGQETNECMIDLNAMHFDTEAKLEQSIIDKLDSLNAMMMATQPV